MSEVKKIATREGYGDGLAELGAVNPNVVVLDADLAAATKTGVFKKAFPERFFDCGIAEGNMMGIAAGLATTGKIPFASTFAMFAAGRAYEQVRDPTEGGHDHDGAFAAHFDYRLYVGETFRSADGAASELHNLHIGILFQILRAQNYGLIWFFHN